MGQDGLAATPATARELGQSRSGVVCKGAAGATEGWDVPVFVWEYNRGCEQTLSAHRETVLSVFDEGSLLERTDGRLAGRRGGEGSASIALAHGESSRRYVALRRSLVTHFYFRRAFLSALIAEGRERIADEPTDRIFTIDARIAMAARDYAARAFDADDPPMALEMNARSILLGIDILRTTEHIWPNKSIKLNHYKTNKIIDMVDSQMNKAIYLEDMASELNYSKSHFLYLFKNTFGMTPHQFLMKRRINRAKDLLKGGTLPLSQIALDCGFASQQHFSTVFRRSVGVSPSAYRLGSA